MTQTSPGGFVRTEDQAILDTEALKLRSKGFTYRQIGEELGVTGATAFNRCKRALGAIPAEAAEEYRKLELERLDSLEQVANDVLATKHVFVSQGGKVVYDGDFKLIDHGPTLQAIASLLRIQERRAKLLGLDAPVRQQVETITYDGTSIEARVAELRSALGRLGSESVSLDG